MASNMKLLLVVVAASLFLATVVSAASGDGTSSSSSSSSSRKCVKLAKWDGKFEKILRETLRDLRRDRKAAAQELKVTNQDSKDLIAELRKAWKMRCGVGCKKWQQWVEYLDIRKALVKYHRVRLESHGWYKKLREQEDQLAVVKAQLIQQHGKEQGLKLFKEQQKDVLASVAAVRSGAAAKGIFKLVDVITGMVHDAESALSHAKGKVQVWKSMCKSCRKDGKAELSNLKDVIEKRRDNATKRRRNAEKRIQVIKGLLRTLLDARDKREEGYTRFNFHGCKQTGQNSYQCYMSPLSKSSHLDCFRFHKCSKHNWDAAAKRVTSKCSL